MECVGVLVGTVAGFLALTTALAVTAYRWGRETGATEQRTWWAEYDQAFGGDNG